MYKKFFANIFLSKILNDTRGYSWRRRNYTSKYFNNFGRMKNRLWG
jgi:hypothetical protein